MQFLAGGSTGSQFGMPQQSQGGVAASPLDPMSQVYLSLLFELEYNICVTLTEYHYLMQFFAQGGTGPQFGMPRPMQPGQPAGPSSPLQQMSQVYPCMHVLLV
jgi:hypothetical protein